MGYEHETVLGYGIRVYPDKNDEVNGEYIFSNEFGARCYQDRFGDAFLFIESIFWDVLATPNKDQMDMMINRESEKIRELCQIYNLNPKDWEIMTFNVYR